MPDHRDGVVVIIPEFAFFFGAIDSFGAVSGSDGVGLPVFKEEVREADFY